MNTITMGLWIWGMVGLTAFGNGISISLLDILKLRGINNSQYTEQQLMEAAKNKKLAQILGISSIDLSNYLDGTPLQPLQHSLALAWSPKPCFLPSDTIPILGFGIIGSGTFPVSGFDKSISQLIGGATYDSSGVKFNNPVEMNVNLDHLPIPNFEFYLQKNFSNRLQLGFYFLPNLTLKYVSVPFLKTLGFIGGDFQWLFFQPDEGLNFYLKFYYHYSQLTGQIENLKVSLSNNTFSPSIIGAKKIGFFEPYFGVTYQHITSSLGLKASFLDQIDLLINKNTSMNTFNIVTGILLTIPIIKLTLGLEGAFNQMRAHYISLRFGMAL